MEQTLVLLKPDAVQRGLCGEILGRFERKGLLITALRMLQFDEELVRLHYQEHVAKPFFPELAAYIQSGPVVALVLEGDRAVSQVRALVGSTDPLQAVPGSIRGDYALSVTQNVVHASDSPESARRERERFFPPAAEGGRTK